MNLQDVPIECECAAAANIVEPRYVRAGRNRRPYDDNIPHIANTTIGIQDRLPSQRCHSRSSQAPDVTAVDTTAIAMGMANQAVRGQLLVLS